MTGASTDPEILALLRSLANPWDDPDLVGTVNAGVGELAAALGIRFVEVGRDRVRATMPVVGNRQPFGLLHGGASAALAETVGSIHAVLIAPPGQVGLGTELSCTHHRAVTEGTVEAVCTPLHIGRTMVTLEIAIRDEADRRVCTARLSCLLRAPR
ncbi:hotdog fold thioesterase [Nakamurella flavida]|uniref:Hotdog fold thioesterase n=1 Tax=Nakamurella flavida TaxID=363630 RepID=A0A939BZ85_9ACTN|nr:hotdog fold thioesterase [Nakamurella flavida]MBM9475468.1 hotdog fold thioesterase [Nakamurella flavida]MDP9777024.1 uncharacterized protein (TIGR00369 family) [Nakamurella flavida]